MLAVVDKASANPVAVRLGEGLRAACGIAGVTFVELAARLGVRPEQVSTWATGSKQLQLARIEQIERILDVQRGTILRFAGYVDDGQLNLGSLEPWAQKAIRAILREVDPPSPGEVGARFDGDPPSSGEDGTQVDGELQEAVRGDGHDGP